MMRVWIFFAGLFGAAGVALGAFHAHGLEGWLEDQQVSSADIEYRLDLCETAVRYLLIQAVALLGIVILSLTNRMIRTWAVVGVGFILGTLLFSGALLAMAFTGNKQFAHLAPFGGITLIGSWLLFALSAFWYPRENLERFGEEDPSWPE
ncbi:MAG: DUF423 domain-containing protein [Planctomycetota bacterium]